MLNKDKISKEVTTHSYEGSGREMLKKENKNNLIKIVLRERKQNLYIY